MIKQLCTILLSALLVAPTVWGQTGGCPDKGCASFAPHKGQWEFSLMLGSSGSVYGDDQTALLPMYNSNYGSIGLPNGGTATSGNLSGYLNLTGFDNNNLVNILGIQAKYFFHDSWAVNLSAGMNIGVTPKKDYIEAEYEDLDNLRIPDQKYVNAQVNNNWYINAGVDRYFKTSNERIHPYVGVTIGMQMARIHTKQPYTGIMVDDEDLSDLGEQIEEAVYLAPGRVGQMIALKGAAVAGIEYSLTRGMFLAVECQPVSYRYDLIQMAPQGFDKYNLCHHNIKLIDMPIVKLGFRF